MKTRTLSLVALLAAWTLVLTGCNKSNTETPAEEQPLNEAAQYCVDNGWTHEIVTSETAVYGECTLPDGTVCDEWDYYEGKCPEGTGEDKSLTIEEINELMTTHFPKSYTFVEHDFSTDQQKDSWEYTFTEEDKGQLIKDLWNVTEANVMWSGIQDWMIYTEVVYNLEEWEIVKVLYIVDPDTMNFVAATVSKGDLSTNYQYSY